MTKFLETTRNGIDVFPNFTKTLTLGFFAKTVEVRFFQTLQESGTSLTEFARVYDTAKEQSAANFPALILRLRLLSLTRLKNLKYVNCNDQCWTGVCPLRQKL